MINTVDYAWLSAVVYARGDANQYKAEEIGWEVLKYVSDMPEMPEYGGDEANGFSSGAYQ